uniref:Putative secreted protein n=1 Tax=Anopheles darlingi TaxID=43151 RepID=A0A2M4D631_ANODA
MMAGCASVCLSVSFVQPYTHTHTHTHTHTQYFTEFRLADALWVGDVVVHHCAAAGKTASRPFPPAARTMSPSPGHFCCRCCSVPG